jgi:diamine N-acetyltransferase
MHASVDFALCSDAQAATIAALARETWSEHYIPLLGRAQVEYMLAKFQSATAIAQQIRDERYEYFLIKRAEVPIGYCALQPDLPERCLFLSKLYLLRTTRGLGLGRLSMAFIEQLARQRGFERIWLTVNKRNPTVAVYRSLGFSISAEVAIDIGEGFVTDDYRMEKPLV